MNDYYTNYTCSSGHCPLIVEEEKYGVRTSTCEDYCGSGFGGCNNCYYENSELCEECVHKANNSNAENKELLKVGESNADTDS